LGRWRAGILFQMFNFSPDRDFHTTRKSLRFQGKKRDLGVFGVEKVISGQFRADLAAPAGCRLPDFRAVAQKYPGKG